MVILRRCLSVVLSALLLVAALLGPLGLGHIRFHVSRSAEVQYTGGEVVTVVCAIILIAHALLPRARWRILIPGVCVYLMYTFITVVMGQDYRSVPTANAEKAFGLYVAIMATSLVLLVVTMTVTQAASPGPRALTATRWFALTLGALFASLWAMQIAQVYGKEPVPAYEADPALFWLIKFLDYSFLIPALIMVGVTLPRRQAVVAAPVLVVFAALLASAIACMGVAQALDGEDGAWVVALFMVTIAAVAVSVATPWVRASPHSDPQSFGTAKQH